MEVIQFPLAKDPLDFDGIAIKFDIEKQLATWAAIFASIQFAVRFCSFNHVEAEKTVDGLLDRGDAGLLDNMSADWMDDIGRLEAIIAIMKSAAARVDISKDRALARTRRIGE
jgi:hypothetical protein